MISFNQEQEHQTQGFLDGLAVSRLTIFFAKATNSLAGRSPFLRAEAAVHTHSCQLVHDFDLGTGQVATHIDRE